MKLKLLFFLIALAGAMISNPLVLSAADVSQGHAQQTWRKDGEGAKRMGSQRDIDSFIHDINGRIRTYQDRKGLAELEGEQLKIARKEAFKEWAYEHHNDIKLPKLSQDAESMKFHEIENTEVPSNVGVVDLDWLATMGKWGLGEIGYLAGKEYWLWKRQAQVKKEYWPDRSTTLNTYQDTNWRAVAVSDRLLSGEVSVEEVFQPQHQAAPSVQKIRDKLQSHFAMFGNFSWSGTGTDRFRSDNSWSAPQESRSFIPNPARSDGPRSLRSVARDMFASSPVGGVYLQGAGAVLDGFGEIKGFRFDPRSRELILLGETESATGLKGLSLADVVTVFRAVYASVGPTLTIDPDPHNPEGPRMWVISDSSTKNSFVHWILYHCDRTMKSYSLAKDNLTGTPVESGIAGYSEVLDAIFSGPDGERRSVWERFWIVPAFSRMIGPRGVATAFLDFPLEVRTKKCVLRRGKMVDDEGAPSSQGALAFRQWFTMNYNAIGQETLMMPPAEFGFEAPIDIFAVLRRIAAITAIAERLRDQGTPMPTWMVDYEVPRVIVDPTTPSISNGREARRGNTLIQTRVFGGVELAFDSAPRKTLDTVESINALPSLAREGALGKLEEAQEFEKILSTLSPGVGVTVSPITGSDTVSKMARLPGVAASVLGPCQLDEVDLDFPMGSKQSLRFTRRYNSAFRTQGPWGAAWSLDLPRLQTNMVQMSRDEKSRTLQQVYELHRPLTSGPLRFARIGPIRELQTTGYLPARRSEILGLVRGGAKYGNTEFLRIHFNDGEVWQFDNSGRFLASLRSDSSIEYEYGNDGKATKITGKVEGQQPVVIQLTYDRAGRIKTAAGQSGIIERAADYGYDPKGNLTEVKTRGCITRYAYREGKIVEVSCEETLNGEVSSTRFDYDAQGRVMAQTQGNGNPLRLQMESSNEGPTMSVWDENTESPFATVSYDAGMEPSVIHFRDGSQIRRTGFAKGRPTLALTGADGQSVDLPSLGSR